MTAANKVNHDLSRLLHRAIHDDGPEGDNAIRMFRQKARKLNEVNLFCLDQSDSHPLMILLKDADETIERLKKELVKERERTKHLPAARAIPVDAFPWDKHPEVEKKAAIMFLKGIAEIDIEDFVMDQTGADERKGRIINARFINGHPPQSLNITVKTGSGSIGWDELWKIGSSVHTKAWMPRVLRYAGVFDDVATNDRLPKMLITQNPNSFISPEKRNALRDLYHTGRLPTAKTEAEMLILGTAERGITKKKLGGMGMDSRRVVELINTSRVFFVEDRLVHRDFASYYPVEWETHKKNHGID